MDAVSPPVLDLSVSPPAPGSAPESLHRLRSAAGSVLLVGDHLERIGQLTSELLSAGCRVEIARRSSLRQDAQQAEQPHTLVVTDGVGLPPRAASELYREAVRAYENACSVALVEYRTNAVRTPVARMLVVPVRVRTDGLLSAPSAVVRDVADAWASLQAIALLPGLEIERRSRRAVIGGVPVVLSELEHRLLCALAEAPHASTNFPELCRAIGRSRAAHDGRSGNAVRRLIARLDAGLRPAGATLETTSAGIVRLRVFEGSEE